MFRGRAVLGPLCRDAGKGGEFYGVYVKVVHLFIDESNAKIVSHHTNRHKFPTEAGDTGDMPPNKRLTPRTLPMILPYDNR